MKQKITAVRTILLRGFACILSTVFGISFLLNGSAFLHLQQNWGTLMEMVRLQYKMRAGFWKPMQKSLPVSPRMFQVT